MDEQIKPVAWVDTDDLEYLVADGEVCADMHNSRVGECFAPLYSQQSIDALRAEVDELNEAFNILGALADEQQKRAERAEAERNAMVAERDRMAVDGGNLAAALDRASDLADKWDRIADVHGVRQFTGNDHRLFANELRAAIDAARKGAE